MRRFERSLMCACAAPAASQRVAVQVRQDVTSFADAPPVDEILYELSPESCSVAFELLVSGHDSNGTARS